MNFWKVYQKWVLVTGNIIAYYTHSEFLLFLFFLLNDPLIVLALKGRTTE
jgi:hypothetical protein